MRFGGRSFLVAAGALTVAVASPRAEAFPAFARKYGLRCTACHEAWPVLNDFGVAFRDNGYQLMLGKDDPVTTHLAYIPVSIRLTPHYEFDSVSNQDTDQGKKDIKSGSVSTIGIDLLTGGTLANNVSFLVVPTGFTTADGVSRVGLGPLRQHPQIELAQPEAGAPRGRPSAVGAPALEPLQHGLPDLQLSRAGIGVALRHGREPAWDRVGRPRPRQR